MIPEQADRQTSVFSPNQGKMSSIFVDDFVRPRWPPPTSRPVTEQRRACLRGWLYCVAQSPCDFPCLFNEQCRVKDGCKIKRAHRPTSLFSAQSRGQGHLHGWFRTSMIIAASCFTADWSMPSMFLDDDEVSEHKHLVPINDQRQSSSMISHDPECLTPYHRTFVDDFSRQVSRSSRSNSELY